MLQLLFTAATAYNLNVARAPAPTMAAATELPKLYVYGALRSPPRHLTAQLFSRQPSTIQPQPTKRLTAPPRLRRTDHCPFCVRVRVAAGVLGIKHNLVFMANDDIPTPTALIGKKIAPIWVDEDGPMMESLDIIEKIDSGKVLKPASGRTDLKAWQKSVQTLLRKLQRPRYVMVPLPEFMQKDGRDAFVANHQMPPFEKKDWKGAADFPIEKKYGYYEEAFGQTAELLPELNKALLELEPLICCPDCCTEGGVSYDDIDLWARLRSLTIIKGVELPPKVRAYLDNFEAKGDVPLYDTMAV